ncbi:hypothetical protein JYB88_05940 [Shewanella cyperi]|uniref:Uncharacterized protein n=1 Tax=Shewanella cyperi TaxID=2814292 RepID=A0A974XPT5_9GAMM|nr:hypothetical protein [Shewanella cyperi]QSX31178.1 hypothetical protein JYB88_05940 [Shewanella cyperi]
MNDLPIYHFKRSRKQRAKLFTRMGLFCWLYILGLFAYESLSGQRVPEDIRLTLLIALSLASAVLFFIAWWHMRHPAEYEAIITRERFRVRYPDHAPWSFDVAVAEIAGFENRQASGHAGKGMMQHGILMRDGRFFHISMNYDNKISDMYQAVKTINPGVSYPKAVNKKASGLGIKREYKD